MYQHIVDTPIGWFRIVGNDTHIVTSGWINEEDALVGGPGAHIQWKREAEMQIQEYFKGARKSFNLPLFIEGSDFQSQIWTVLKKIPFGLTRSYSELAEELGDSKKARAVGSAVGENPFLLLVPCHRIIGSDGSLTGFAGGLERKEWLLKHEGAFGSEQLELF